MSEGERKKNTWKSQTIQRRHLRRLNLAASDSQATARPVTRGDCASIPRPCPFVSCKHHLYLDVLRSGSIKINFPGLGPDEITESCALDVADRGGETLEALGALMHLTGERVRQTQQHAMKKAGFDSELARFLEAEPGQSVPEPKAPEMIGAGEASDDAD